MLPPSASANAKASRSNLKSTRSRTPGRFAAAVPEEVGLKAAAIKPYPHFRHAVGKLFLAQTQLHCVEHFRPYVVADPNNSRYGAETSIPSLPESDAGAGRAEPSPTAFTPGT